MQRLLRRDLEVAYFFFSCKNFRQAHLKPDLNVNQYNIFQNISCVHHRIFSKTLVHFFHFLCILFGIYSAAIDDIVPTFLLQICQMQAD